MDSFESPNHGLIDNIGFGSFVSSETGGAVKNGSDNPNVEPNDTNINWSPGKPHPSESHDGPQEQRKKCNSID